MRRTPGRVACGFSGACVLALALVAGQDERPIGSETVRSRDFPGIWISRSEIMSRPTSGAAWETMLDTAEHLDPHGAQVWNKDSQHDVETLAAALAGVRLGDHALKVSAQAGLVGAIGTEVGDDWLAVSRNMTAYIVAADVLRTDALIDPRIDAWFEDFLDGTIQLPNNSGQGGGCCRGISPFHSGSNGAAQEGAVYVALAAYLNNRAALEYGWERFRVYVGDRPVTNSQSEGPTIGHINISLGIQYGWSHDPNDPKPINPIGSTLTTATGITVDVDGIIINDQRRGGPFDWPPGYTQYPWLGLEGAVPAGLILHRMGYPSMSAGDSALLRAVEAQWRLGILTGQSPMCTGEPVIGPGGPEPVEPCWWDYDRATDIKHLVNWFYGTSYPYEQPVGKGRTMGWTDWTHP